MNGTTNGINYNAIDSVKAGRFDMITPVRNGCTLRQSYVS